jgi:mannitol/fructose-specific phosphotransferase system IIA component (Ntr-type)
VSELLTEQLISLDMEVNGKLDAISAIADLLLGEGRLLDRDGYVRDVLAREDQIETGIGHGIAIPHAKSDAVATPAVAYLRLTSPVVWGDSGPARHIFGIAVPGGDAGGVHLKILASLARRLLDDETRSVLDTSSSKSEILDALRVDPGGGD